MIDRDLIESLDDGTAENVKVALATIGYSQIILLQEERLMQRIAEGHDQESDADLILKIKNYRRDVAKLRELQSLCQTFQQEPQQ